MAKTIGAKVSKLGKLHELLTDMFIQDIEFCIREQIPMSASDKGVIVTFLKNEDITAMPDDAAIDKLREDFAELEPERKAKAMSILNSANELANDIPMS